MDKPRSNKSRPGTGKTARGGPGKTARGGPGKTARGGPGKTTRGGPGKTARGGPGKTTRGGTGKTTRGGTGKPATGGPGRTSREESRLSAGSGSLGPRRTGQRTTGSAYPAKGKVKHRSPGGSKPGDDLVRLNKFIAASGICSRREADQLITAGLITVNGKSITELGTKVSPGDDVRYNGKRMRNERKVYLLLNKPKDYVTTTDDPRERKTVMLLIRGACNERIYPVGRLDRQTTGVLLFTNDGEMAKKLTHPGHNKKKIYHVFLNKGVTGGDLQKLAGGITLEDGFIQPDAISYVSTEHKREIGLEIHSGRNRVVRRMFEHLGYRVAKLDRVYFAGLTKKNVPRGKWRFLTEKEVTRLKMNAYE